MRYQEQDLEFDDDVTQRLDRRRPEPRALDLEQKRPPKRDSKRVMRDDTDYGYSDHKTHSSVRRYTQSRETEEMVSVVPYRNQYHTTRTPVRRFDTQPRETYSKQQEPVPLYCDGWHVNFQFMCLYTFVSLFVGAAGGILLFMHYVIP